MAINNPYVPGDPYSYDLKWIVRKLKEHSTILTTLDEKIVELIGQLMGTSSPVYFKTAEDLIHSEIEAPALSYIEGYNEEGDGGANLFYVTSDYNDVLAADFYLTLDGANRWAIPIIVTPYVTPEMFGAKGDGIEDDHYAIQTACEIAHKTGAEVVLHGKVYGIKTGLTLKGGADNTKPGIFIKGMERGNVCLKAIDAMTSVITVTSDNTDCANVFIEHLMIDADNNADHGISFNKPSANCRLYDLKINHANDWGVKAQYSFYLTTIEKVRVDNSGGGFKLDGTGTNTSLRLADCFVQGCPDGYKVQAIYSTMINCCADAITGTVFNLEHFTGTLIGCGTEATGATTVFNGGNGTCVAVVNPMTFMLSGSSATQINAGPGGRWYFYGGRLSHSEGGSTAPGFMYKMALASEIYFDGTVLGKYAQTNTYSNITARVHFKGQYGQVNTRYDSKLAYLGLDGYETAQKVNPSDQTNEMQANAIYMGLSDQSHRASDNLDLQWNGYTMKGDIMLTQDPIAKAGIGWIQGEDVTGISGARWTTGTFKKIPIVLAGDTADRPILNATIDAGTMYYDTTLLKPIWWTGGAWRDATGATV